MELSVSGKLVKIILKVIELLFVIIAISLYLGVGFKVSIYQGTTFFCDGSLFMAIILTPLLLVFGLAGQNESNLFETIINFILGIFLIATGSVTINYWTGAIISKSKSLAMGSMCIIGGLVYLGDCVYSFFMYKSSD